MKKILILTTVSGFLDKFEKDNVRILQELGYEVHYAANTYEQNYLFDENEIQNMGVHIHHIDIAKSPYKIEMNQRALKEVTELIEKEQICAIHCHTPVGGLLGRLAGRRCRVKVIYTAHGFHFYKGAPFLDRCIYYLAERWLARFTDTLIVINEEDYKNAQKFHLKNQGKVYQIPGVGLDMKKFRPFSEAERGAGRRKLGIEKFSLISVGELNQNKNQRIVLQALAKMREDGNDISHIHYGVCGDGFLRQQMEHWIQELHLGDIVTMYGYQDSVHEILGCADAMIFPSRREGLGMAALEALSMGIPVIASDNRGTREYMEHGKNGYVCAWDDVDGYIKGIQRMMALRPKERETMRQYCRQSVKRFEKSHTNRIMWEIYHRMDETIKDESNERSSQSQCTDECLQSD